MQLQPEITALGDAAVIAKFGTDIDPQTHRRVRALYRALRERPFEGMIEAVPAFTSVAVYYDSMAMYRKRIRDRTVMGPIGPEESPFLWVRDILEKLLVGLERIEDEDEDVVGIPVCYGGENGPDLEAVAVRCGLTPEEVVRIHASGTYKVYMLGFAPGFPYLGGVDPRLAVPRRATPRLFVARGSVGLAGGQTGIYPADSPGGWQLIGRTPLSLFFPDRTPPTLLRVGQTVKFIPIGKRQFDEWGKTET